MTAEEVFHDFDSRLYRLKTYDHVGEDMYEHSGGDWVLWDDVRKIIDAVEDDMED